MTNSQFYIFENKNTIKSKYHAKPTIIDNIRFASQKEAKYYSELKLLVRAKEVIKFELQPKFDIIINGKKCGFYKADFKVYFSSGIIEVWDVKGFKTPVYALKKKIIEAMYSIKIIEK